jgi:putative phosphoribosyl transferase
LHESLFWQKNFASLKYHLISVGYFLSNRNMRIVEEGRIFVDRSDAGFEVGKLLEEKYKDKNALVLAIPRGGVIVAYEVAKILNGELSVIITKKLPHPLHEEFAIGATAEDGSVFLTSAAETLNGAAIQRIVKAQSQEIQSRIQRFRKGKPLPAMSNRIVIIVDDGIATGSTIVPAIKLCRLRKAAKVIVAAPVSDGYVSEIDHLADEVVIVEQPKLFYAVGQVYEDFHHLSDEEVISVLEDFEKQKSK